MSTVEIDNQKLAGVMELIDRIADEFATGTNANEEIAIYEHQLKQLTGKDDINTESFAEYWGWTTLEDLARSLLMPTPVYKGLSDNELTDIVTKIINCEYSESETDYYLNALEIETGLINISDYIFYPETVGFLYKLIFQKLFRKYYQIKSDNLLFI